MGRFTGLLGLIVILAVAWLFSTHKREIKLRLLAWGMGLQFLFALHHDRFSYTGEKTHRTKVLAYVNKVRVAEWEERTLLEACDCLLGLGEVKRARTFAERGSRRFHNNPYFPYFEASSYFLDRPDRMPFFQVRMMLEEAERLVRDWPADDRRERLIQDIRQRREQLEVLDPFGSRAMELFGGFDPFGDEDEFDAE